MAFSLLYFTENIRCTSLLYFTENIRCMRWLLEVSLFSRIMSVDGDGRAGVLNLSS